MRGVSYTINVSPDSRPCKLWSNLSCGQCEKEILLIIRPGSLALSRSALMIFQDMDSVTVLVGQDQPEETDGSRIENTFPSRKSLRYPFRYAGVRRAVH